MAMHDELIENFYKAFQKRDWQTMQSLYHENATFSDPVFQNLTSRQVQAMWHMLLQTSSAIIITFRQVKSEAKTGSCHWEATYDFSRTGRKVHNVIDAVFEFKDGKILRHMDKFSLWRWSAMALGLSGILLGWSPFVRNKIRKIAGKALSKFIDEHPEYQ